MIYIYDVTELLFPHGLASQWAERSKARIGEALPLSGGITPTKFFFPKEGAIVMAYVLLR